MGSDSAVTQPTTRQSLRAAAGIVTACLLLVCAAVPGCGRPATPQQELSRKQTGVAVICGTPGRVAPS